MRKTRKMTMKEDSKIYVPPMVRAEYPVDETETEFIPVHWVNKQEFDKGEAETIIVVLLLDSPILVEWNLFSGKIVTGSMDLIRKTLLNKMNKIIKDFGVIYRVEEICKDLSKEQSVYDPEDKMRKRASSARRPEDGVEKTEQVAGYHKQSGAYVSGYERRPRIDATPSKRRRSDSDRRYKYNQDKVLSLIKEGYKYREVSSQLGISYQRVYQIARANGISRQNRNPVYSESEILNLARQGVKYAEIAETVGVSATTVSKLARANGIKRR